MRPALIAWVASTLTVAAAWFFVQRDIGGAALQAVCALVVWACFLVDLRRRRMRRLCETHGHLPDGRGDLLNKCSRCGHWLVVV